ncbi:uncharacterized protein [Drosophila kikkawai]|uniref:Uncharacterized protein n=1 Tax=Drosophila kikkawai TaxID=30033 RepID=A0A6P4HSZ3_DROKI|nr:uncharacterized protein LOC108072506 [Drosophila kikkawai]
MSDQPHNGVGRLRLKVWLWISVAALVVIVLAIVLLILPSLIITKSLVPNVVATYIFFVLGLVALCVYACVTWLRRQFPYDWVICGVIAVLLAFGTVSVLHEREPPQVLLLSVEILIMLVLLLLFGSYQLPNWPTIAQLLIGWYLFAVLASFIVVMVFQYMTDTLCAIKVAMHFALWEVAFPVVVFQAQVISGFWDNVPPLLDKPLCSVMLVLDFLACYAFLACVDDIATFIGYFGKASSQKFFMRLME